MKTSRNGSEGDLSAVLKLTPDFIDRLAVVITENPEAMKRLAEAIAHQTSKLGPATYTADEVAELLGVKRRTVMRRIEAGVYPRVPGLYQVRLPGAFVQKLLDPQDSGQAHTAD